jgi:hypothetical protein
LKFKLTFGFMANTYEPLHLDKRSFVQWKIMEVVKCYVLFEVRIEFLNIIKTSFGFKGLLSALLL